MRIAHISDLHLRHHLPGTSDLPRRLSRRMPILFARALEQIRSDAPDLLVVSGDLLDYPLLALDDPEMLARGEQDLRLLADLLATMTCPYVVVHGNHDHPGLTRQIFGHLPTDQVCAGYRVLCFRDDEGADHVPQRVGGEAARFAQALADEVSLPQIHVQHYLIWPEQNVGYPHTYGNGRALRDAIVSSGRVRLALSGHYHPGIPPIKEENTYFSVVPSFAEAPHPYWIYDLNGDGITYCQREVTDEAR